MFAEAAITPQDERTVTPGLACVNQKTTNSF
jgi:hypothetical protein